MSAVGLREEMAASGLGRALVPFVACPPRFSGPHRRAALLIAVCGLATGLGGVSAYDLWHTPGSPGTRKAAIAASTLAQLQMQVAQLQHGIETLRGATETARADDGARELKRGLDNLKQDIDQSRASSAATVAALSARIDKVDHNSSPKLADIALRLDRIEKQASAAGPTPAAPSRAVSASLPKPVAAVMTPVAHGGVTQVPATPANALPDKPVTVGGWALRDVYDGIALVEARGGGLREVQPGEYLPGAGQVRSIERRGRSWVVMTSRGVIDKTF